MERRTLLKGMAGILAAATAPWVVTKAGVLMPVKQLAIPKIGVVFDSFANDTLNGNWELEPGLRVYRSGPLTYLTTQTHKPPANMQLLATWRGAVAAGDTVPLDVKGDLCTVLLNGEVLAMDTGTEPRPSSVE